MDNELLQFNREFKKAILDVVFTQVDTFYLHCIDHPELILGNRGLLENEKEQGIVLVFGPYSTKHLHWDDQYIFCEMQFNRWEHLQIPFECISRIFDKGGQVIMQWATPVLKTDEPETKIEANDDENESRVIEVDFKKRNKKD